MEGLVIGEGHPADAALRDDFCPDGVTLGFVVDVPELHGENGFRLVIEVAAQCGRPNAGRPEQLRGPQGIGGDHHEFARIACSRPVCWSLTLTPVTLPVPSRLIRVTNTSG